MAAPATSGDPDLRFSGLPGRPGKIIAVHLSYASRAEQRGRRPEFPSYFFKPTSSVASSGSPVERPVGTELLTFEGEIALIMSAAARDVSPSLAWQHVGWVTAANDFGLFDFRANDRGSNVRSKGRDGYTPIGPSLINARDVDPYALRLRTWVNGRIAQNDTARGLIFTLVQLVADLSQHFTLEPGDVILTGTPAGASVVVPGDTIEVEVDVPGGPTSGRLTSTVVEVAGDFDANLGSLPSVDDLQRAEAWGSRELAGLSPDEATSRAGTISNMLRTKLEMAPVAGLSAQLRKRGLNNATIDGVLPLASGARMVGTAKTLRFIPNREDLFASHGAGYNAQKRAFDEVQPGEVLVIEARGESGSGTLGDILAIRAHERGAAGIVTDGGLRDIAAITSVGIPVWSRGAHPAVLGRKHVPWEIDVTVGCGGTSVQPGDIIVADADGVIVIPPALVEEVVDAALEQEIEDAWIAARVAEGHPLDGLFPMNAKWRSRFEAETEI